MNPRLREFERESGLEIYGLGARRDRWERALEKYAELIVQECAGIAHGSDTPSRDIKDHFRVESKNEFICPKCGADRLRVDCPSPNRLDCGIKVEAQ